MVGGTMELWGTVPDATDRAMVQMLALNVAGVASLKDHIQVQNGSSIGASTLRQAPQIARRAPMARRLSKPRRQM